MSGAEVAGLALAVFPIVVDGMRQFTEALETVRRWRWYRREVSNYLRTMEAAKKYLVDTLTELFDGIVLSHDDLMALAKDPTSFPWYDEQLKKRLDHNYDTYLETMISMRDTLEILRNKLGLDDQPQVRWYNATTIEREVNRTRLVLSKKIYQGLLAEIEKANRDLRDCTHQSIRLEPLRQSRRPHLTRSADFRRIRQRAKSLFTALVSGKSWKCLCREYHGASLRLEARPWERNSDRDHTSARSGDRFYVLLHTEDGESKPIPSWEWQAVEIRHIDLTTLASDPSSAGNHNTNMASFSLTPRPKFTSKKSVRFEIQAVQHPPKVGTSDFAQELPYHNTRLITDLCTQVTSAGVTDCLGLLPSEASHHEGHVLFCTETRTQAGMKYSSLTSLLSDARSQIGDQRLSWESRLEIAVTLASSVLQLDGTSWLKTTWRTDDILFLPTCGAQIGQKLDYAHPYISWKIGSRDTSTDAVHDATQRAAHRIRHDMLFALGVTLVELSFGQVLSELRTPADIDSTQALTEFNTACRLEPYVYSERGSRVGDVVRRCLECPFDVRDKSLDNPTFQDLVFAHIVQPLKDELENFRGCLQIR